MNGRGAVIVAMVVVAVVAMTGCGVIQAAGMEPDNGMGPAMAGILPATAPGSDGRNHSIHGGRGKSNPIFGFPSIPPPAVQKDRFWVTGYFWPVIMIVVAITVPAIPPIRRMVMRWWRRSAAAAAEPIPPAAAVAQPVPAAATRVEDLPV